MLNSRFPYLLALLISFPIGPRWVTPPTNAAAPPHPVKYDRSHDPGVGNRSTMTKLASLPKTSVLPGEGSPLIPQPLTTNRSKPCFCPSTAIVSGGPPGAAGATR